MTSSKKKYSKFIGAIHVKIVKIRENRKFWEISPTSGEIENWKKKREKFSREIQLKVQSITEEKSNDKFNIER